MNEPLIKTGQGDYERTHWAEDFRSPKPPGWWSGFAAGFSWGCIFIAASYAAIHLFLI